MESFRIGNKWIGPGHKPFIIAEMSGNHDNNLEKAFRIVDAAAESGADAVKLQTYTADTMTIDSDLPDFVIQDPHSLWSGRKLYDLYEEASTPWDWHKPIIDRCHKKGMVCFSTPFDPTAVDYLENLGVPAYKIASFEATDIPLIKKVAKTGKPVIVSTGMATIAEIEKVTQTLREGGCDQFVLLRCTSSYPADASDANIRAIPHLSETFQCFTGLSDHTLGVGVAVASVALGAYVIEKHFVLDRSEGGIDAAFSMEPKEFKELTVECRRAWHALGHTVYGTKGGNETKSLAYRRSIYITKDIAKGEKFTKDNLRCIRPGFGLPPEHFENIIGCIAKEDLKRGTPMKHHFY